MAGTKRDYTQYLQSTRKVNISDLLAQQAKHNAPRSEDNDHRLSQSTTSRYRPYHQETAGWHPSAPTPAPVPAAPTFTQTVSMQTAPASTPAQAASQVNYAAPYAANHQSSAAVPQYHMSLPYAAMSARAPHSAAALSSQVSPYAAMTASVPAFSAPAPGAVPTPVPSPAAQATPTQFAAAPAHDIPAPPWADDESYAASWDNMPPPPDSYSTTDWDDFAPPLAAASAPQPSAKPQPGAQPLALQPLAPQPIAQAQGVTTLSEVKVTPQTAPAPSVAATSAPAAESQVVSRPQTVPETEPQAQSAVATQAVSQPGAQTVPQPAGAGLQRAEVRRSVQPSADAAPAAAQSGFLKPTPVCDDMPDFAALLALPKQFYQELVAKFTQEGVADPAQVALEATTMHPEAAAKTERAAADRATTDRAAASAATEKGAAPAVRLNSQLLAAADSTGDSDGWHAAKSADDIEINGDFKGWPGALLYQGNFEERMRSIWSAQGLELVSIEDKQYQKLCVLKAGGYQFKVSAFYKDYGAISFVQSSGVGSKASLALAALEDYVGFDIRDLPDLTTLSDEDKAQIKKAVKARNKKKKRKSLSERNSDLKLTSAAMAAQVVSEGKVDVEALAAAGKGKLLTVAERVKLVLKSFDPSFKVTEEEPKPYNFRFTVLKPELYDFMVRVYYKKDEVISSIFIKTSEAMEALANSAECLMLLEQIKEALTQSLVGTGTKILVKPRSAKVNDKHVLEVTYVQF